MATDTISILDGSTFLVSDLRGDIEASPDQPHGFFYRDTRFLSRWHLTANGSPLDVLSTDETQYFASKHFLVPPTGTVNENPPSPFTGTARSATASTRTCPCSTTTRS